MCPSRKRPPRLYDPKADYRSDLTIYRAGATFIVPASFVAKKTGLINKEVAELIRNATKENILKLEEMGVSCIVDDMPLYGSRISVAN